MADAGPPGTTEMHAMIYTCDHIHLRSRDAVKAAGFYIETFGAREVKRVGDAPVQRVVLDLGGLAVFIEQAPPETAPAGPTPCLGLEHVGLRVDDLDAAMADMAARGVKVRAGITERGPGLRIAFVEGPDGALIELLERRAA